MASRKTPETATTKVVLEGLWVADRETGAVAWKAPHANELCPEGCGQHELPAGATQFSCDHGTWDLTVRPGEKPGDAQPE